MTGQTFLLRLVCCPKSLPSHGRSTSPMALPGTAVLSFLLRTQVSPMLRAVLDCLTAQGLEFQFSVYSFFFPFPFLFDFFSTSHFMLHLNLSVCILGLHDVSSVLGQVSGICLVLGFRVPQSTAETVLLLLMLPEHGCFFLVLKGFVLTCVWIKRAREFYPKRIWYSLNWRPTRSC